MDDLDDLEAQMVRAEHARARLTVDQTHLHEAWNREAHANAVRTLQLHGTPALHDLWLDLENQVIDLLHPNDRDYFRNRQ